MPRFEFHSFSPLAALRRRWPLLAALAVAVSAISAGCAGLESQQRKWIFQARPAPTASPEALASLASVHGMKDEWIAHVSPSSGHTIRLHALWAENDDPAAPALLYLHGARRDVGSSAFRIDNMRRLGFSVLAIDYRGFGYSTDEEPSQTGVVEDARAAWRRLGEMAPGRDRYVFGHSLGGAIAVQLAAQLGQEAKADALKGVIVEGTFTSINDMFGTFRWGWLPISMLITERFDSLDAIARVKAPVLIVHGSRDSLVPSRFGRLLYERASGPKRFVLVEGGTHYSTNRAGTEQYRAALHELFGIAGTS